MSDSSPNKESVPTTLGSLDFDKKPSKRMAWILPSIILHVAVIAIWFLMPEKGPRKPQERRMIVKKEQVEQLQQHVEDSNLRELRSEVLRLQEIKRIMAGLRSEKMVGLSGYQSEMRKSSQGDAVKALSELLESQRVFLKEQENLIADHDQLGKLFAQLQPLAQKNELAGITPLAQQGLTLLKEYWPKMEQSNQSYLLLRAKLDDAEGVLGWLNEPTLAKKWDAYSKHLVAILEAHGKVTDEQGKYYLSQSNALKAITGEGSKADSHLEQDKKRQLQFEKVQQLHRSRIEQRANAVKKHTARIVGLDASIKKSEAEKAALEKEQPDVDTTEKKGKKGKGRGMSSASRIKKLDNVIAMYSRSRKTAETAQARELDRMKSEQTKLKNLRPPVPNTDNNQIKKEQAVKQGIEILTTATLDTTKRDQVLAKQKAALKQCEALLQEVKQQKEMSQ